MRKNIKKNISDEQNFDMIDLSILNAKNNIIHDNELMKKQRKLLMEYLYGVKKIKEDIVNEKKRLYNICEQATIFKNYKNFQVKTKQYKEVITPDDISYGDSLYNILYYVGLFEKISKRFKFDVVERLKNMVEKIQDRQSFAIPVPSIEDCSTNAYQIIINIPCENQISEILLMRNRSANFCNLTEELYYIDKINDDTSLFDATQILNILQNSQSICWLRNSEGQKVSWTSFNEQYIDMLYLALPALAITSILFEHQCKKKNFS